MRLLAVVLSWNRRDDTLACLASLRDEGIEAVCVDNGSHDGSADAVAEAFPDVELVRAGVNLGFAGGNNVGIRRALERGADWVLLVNNDATVEPGLRAALEAAAEARPDAGVLACTVLHDDAGGTLWYGGARISRLLGRSPHERVGESDGPPHGPLAETARATGAGMAVSRAAIDATGLFDEALFAYEEDVDWCLRIRRAGLAVVLVPDARVRHKVSASTGGAASTANLYYDTRNAIVVFERHLPLPRGLRGLRRAAIVGAHLAQSARHPAPLAASAAVLRGWRDARNGRLGRAPSS